MNALKWIAAVAVASLTLALQGSAAFAQGGPANLQYTPRPTISPYLNLFNNPNNFANYQLNVQPLINQSDINARQSSNINQLQQELNQVRSGSGLGTTGGGRIRPTGRTAAASFMDLSHYYSGGRVR